MRSGLRGDVGLRRPDGRLRRYRKALPLIPLLLITLIAEPLPALASGPIVRSIGCLTTPSAPTNVRATAGNAQATVTWKASTVRSGCVIADYVVTSSPEGITATVLGSTTTATVTNLLNGTSYTFTVFADDENGSGPQSTPSKAVTPTGTNTVPTAPQSVSATRGNAQATVTWQPPTSRGGAALLFYSVTSSPGNIKVNTANGSTTTATVTGLTNGTAYTFTVTATNSVGTGPASSASNAVTPATVPGAPTGATAVRGNAQATVSWTAPTSNGGSAITGYVVTPYIGTTAQTATTFNTTATSQPITGLTNGTTYTFTVAAINAVGTGPASAASNAVTPATVPGAPTGVTATGGNAQATVSWTAPVSNGGSAITAYVVTPYVGSTAQTATTFNSTATTQTVTGLTNGTIYTFTVAAINGVGTGPASAQSASVTPATVPGAPTNVVATGSNAQAAISWTAPSSNGGSAITSYTVTPFVGTTAGTPQSVGSTVTTTTITGLVNGTTYTFQVVATNSVGSSAPGTSNSATPGTPPGAPTNVTAIAGNAQATVTWTAPSSNGGNPITGYVVTPYIGSAAQAPTAFNSTATTQTVTGLTNGTTYTFTVAAVNAQGTGTASAQSNVVTPATVPGAPTSVTAVGGNAQATVSWTAPGSTGGSAITGYVVTPFIGSTAQTATTFNSTSTTQTVTGLTNGTAYTFTVAAINSVGTGPASAQSAAVTPATVPGAPTNVSAMAGNGQATVAWTAPTSNGGSAITSYTVTPYVGTTAQTPTTFNSTTTTQTVTGLSNGTCYTFQVVATNSVGSGAAGTSNSACPATSPGAPTNVSATGGNAQATLSWIAPASNGGSPITGYVVTPYISNVAQTATTFNSNATTETVAGLMNGTTYTFTVAAINAAGTGPASSPSNTVTPATVPGAPTGVTVSGGNAQVTLTWTAPSSNGGSAITGYLVTPYIGTTAQTATTFNSTATTETVTGLTNGTAYTFTVAAINGVGTGAASAQSASVTPATIPGAPTNVTANGGNAQAVVSWTAPASNGGSAITGYTITPFVGTTAGTPQTAPATATTATVTGLVNGTTYTFQVAATNSVGMGPVGTSNSVTPMTVPQAPGSVTATAGNAQATVTWTAPSNGGSAITGYTVTPFVGTTAGAPQAASATATSATVTGLVNGTTYTFQVVATNAVGNSAPGVSNSVTLATVPGAPTGVVASTGNAQSIVSWSAPSSDGGAAITGYTVTPFVGSTAGTPVTVSGSTTSATVTGLTNGTTYTFQVFASNSQGSGLATTSNAVTIGLPSSPTNVTATAGANNATVSWTASSVTGSSAISGYVVTALSGTQPQNSIAVSASATSATVSGLIGGAAYTFQVVAINTQGSSPPSAPSGSVSPTGSATTYASTVLSDAPSRYYRLGDPSGTIAADSSGAGNSGAYQSGSFQGATSMIGSDSADLATSFNGASGVVTAPSVSALAGDNTRSVELWFKAANSSQQVLFDSGAASTTGQGFLIGITQDGGISGVSPNTAGVYVTFNNDTVFVPGLHPGDGHTHHLVVTLQGTTLFVYFDDATASGFVNGGGSWSALTTQPFTLPTAPSSTANSIDIGSGRSQVAGVGSTFFAGIIDEVAIYPIALSAARVNAHFVAAGDGPPSAPGTPSATGGANQATITWTAAVPNGAPITSYLITTQATSSCTAANATSVLGTATSAMITGLPAGTCAFTVAAINGFGYTSPAAATAAVTISGAASTYPSAVFANAPVVYYRLGDSASPVADSSGKSNVASINGSVTQGAAGALPSDADTANTFGGGYLQDQSFSSLPSGTSPRTYEAWIKTTANGDQVILNYSTPGGCRYQANGIGITGANQVEFTTQADCNAGWFTLGFTSPYSIVNGAWHQIAVTWDGTTVTAYVDGQPIGSQPYNGNQGSVDANGLIVGNLAGGRKFNGSLDEVAIYPSALTAAQILGHFQASGNSRPTAPTGITTLSGANKVTVSWNPVSNSSAVTGYLVTAYQGTTAKNAISASATSTSTTLSGLQGGTAYTFQVQAANNFGIGSVGTSAAVTPSGAATTYASTVQGDTPVYYYRLDDSSTLVGDSSGNGRVAYASGTYTQGAPGALANDGDPAMTFTSTSYVQFAQGTALPSGTSPRTYEAWVKTTSTIDQVLLNFTTPGGCRVPANGLGITGGTQVEFLTAFDCNGAWFTLAFTAPYSIADGAWHQVAATWDGTTVTAYVDGQQIGATQAYNANQGTVDSNGLSLGSIGGGRHLVGGLDDVSIYPGALTATQILNHFKASGNGLPGAPTGVTATSGQNSAVVKWTAPTPSVGAITKYTVTPTTDGIAGTAVTTDGTATSVSVPNLTGGASYTFTVTAGNAIGNGPASTPSAAITINAAPNGTNPIGPGFGQYLYFRHFGLQPFPDGTVAFETENTLPTLSTWTVEGYLQLNPTTQTTGSGGVFGLITGQAGSAVAGISWDQNENGSFVWPLAAGGQGSAAVSPGVCDSFFSHCPFKHLVLEYDGTNISGYVNGALVYGPTPPTSSAAITINTLAGLVDHDLWTAVGLDEVRVSSVARYSGASITEPTGPFTNDASTVLLWHLDEQGVRKMWQVTEPNNEFFKGEFPDSSGNHHGMEFFTVGQNCIACGSTYRVYALGQGRTAAELDGDGSPWECPCTLSHTDWPVNSATGEFWHTFDDISVPGRGFGLDFSRTYSSANSSVLGPLGYGWSDTLQGGLTFATVNGVALVTVHAGNGSATTFTQNGGTFTAGGQVLASLTLTGGVYTLTQQDGTQLTFDSTGKLTSQTDRNGYANTFNYDMTTHLLTSVTESNKGNSTPRSLTIAYATGTSLIGSVTDTAGRTVSFGYTGNQLTSSTDINGNTWQYTYDSSNQMTVMKSPLCVATSGCNGIVNVYSNGQVTKQTDALGRVTTFAYSSDGVDSTTTITDPNMNVTVDDYVVGMLVSETKASGTPAEGTWTYAYDPKTQSLLTVTDPNGHITTTLRDSQAHVLTQIDPRGNSTTNTFNSFGEVLVTTPPAPDTAITNVYDATGNIQSTTRPLSGTSQSRLTTYTYGDSTHPGDVTAMTDPNRNTWQYMFDQYGNRTSSTDPLGNQTTYAYDLAGHMTSKVAPRGNVSGCSCALTYTSTYTYWPSGALHVSTDPLGHTTTEVLDADGNLQSETDGDGHVTQYGYDLDDERTSEIDGYGTSQARTIQTVYDGDGNVQKQINALTPPQTTTYAYDAQNHLTSVTDPLNRQTTYAYDAAGNSVSMTDAGGEVTAYMYDAADEVVSVTYQTAQPGNVSYSYQADGKRLSMIDGTGTTTEQYDSLGRVVQVTNGANATVGYGYDLAGNLTSINYPGGVGAVTRTYYANGWLHTISDWLGHTTTFNFDPDGNLSGTLASPGIVYPNGVQQLNTTDAAEQTASITDGANGGSGVLGLTYTRDNAGLLTSENGVSYGPYDPLNRLPTSSQDTYRYDAANRITQISPAGTPNVQTLSYDNADELTSSIVTSGGVQISGYNYKYDSNGNRLTATALNNNVTTFTWDQANHLIGYASSATAAVYTYNGDGVRMSKTVGGSTTQQTWDTAEGLPMIIQDGSTSYVTGSGGLPLEQISGTSVLYYHEDQLGSVRAITDASGNTVETYAYDPYGIATGSGSIAQPFQYSGQYTDPETGFVYLRARYYEPATAQFISRDPAMSSTLVPYAYVEDSPLTNGDPSGLCDWWNPICGVVQEAKFTWGFATGVWDSATGLVTGLIGLPGAVMDVAARVQECGWRCAVHDIAQNELDSYSSLLDDLNSNDPTRQGHACGDVFAAVFEAGYSGGGAKYFAEGGRIKLALHGPHHSFPNLGKRPHIQLNWFKKGKKGSGGVWRWPIPPW